jgi:putative ABC transport system permease protein
MRLAALGILLGIVAAIAAGQELASLLSGVTSTDPVTFAAIACVVATASLVAAFLPARRALRIDPIEALRHEE